MEFVEFVYYMSNTTIGASGLLLLSISLNTMIDHSISIRLKCSGFNIGISIGIYTNLPLLLFLKNQGICLTDWVSIDI